MTKNKESQKRQKKRHACKPRYIRWSLRAQHSKSSRSFYSCIRRGDAVYDAFSEWKIRKPIFESKYGFCLFLGQSKNGNKIKRPTTNVDLPNYNFYHTDPSTPTGVAAIYIKRTLTSILRWDMTLKMMLAKTCWVEIDLCNGQKHILVGCIYISTHLLALMSSKYALKWLSKGIERNMKVRF